MSVPPQRRLPARVPRIPGYLTQAGDKIDEELARRGMAFTDQAGDKLAELNGDYLEDLGLAAVRIARKAELTMVEAAHVKAARSSVESPSRFSRSPNVLFAFGGAAAGAGLSGIYQLLYVAGEHSRAEILFTLVSCVLGGILLISGAILTYVRKS